MAAPMGSICQVAASDAGSDYNVVVPYALPVDLASQLLHQEQYHMVLGPNMHREMGCREATYNLVIHAAELGKLLETHEHAMAAEAEVRACAQQAQ